ncbi:hypothetical protein HID58_013495 [Brassica napus]|uniref:Uncharacterized protein n=1 Tax=Brassica napus TaxID=3708 RepID=A0ABQ8E4L4_BRANA|nr:hypothetical protein HID58_013495 [Brassica napus]
MDGNKGIAQLEMMVASRDIEETKLVHSSLPKQFSKSLVREELSCPEIETSDSSILKETAAARLDAESLSNGSPTSGDNGKVWELGAGAERVDSVVNGEGDNGGIGLDNMDSVENEGDKGGIGLDNLDSVENDGDKGGIGLDKMDSVENEGDVDNSMGVRPISDYIELSRVAKEISVVKEWEDGLGFLLLQEFPSK